MKKALAVNVSTLHPSSANPLFDSLWEFSFLKLLSLHPQQSDGLLQHKHSISVQLQTLAMLPSMIKQFQSKRIQDLIRAYKCGELPSDKFLEMLKDIAIPNLANALPTNYNVFLKYAWTVRIQPFDAAYRQRLDHLISQIDNDAELSSIRLITNSNALDMQQLLIYLHAARADVFPQPNIDVTSTDESVVIGHYKRCEIKLDTSFNHQKFKHPSDPMLNTASMLSDVVSDLKAMDIDPNQITVISHWPRDLKAAQNLNLATQSDMQFFGPITTPDQHWMYTGLAIGVAIALTTSAHTSTCIALLSATTYLINQHVHQLHPQLSAAASAMTAGLFTSTLLSVATSILTTDTPPVTAALNPV